MVDEKELFNAIKNSPSGKYQNSLWKEFGIDSRKCSRLLAKLLEQNLVTREPVVVCSARTYLITAIDAEKPDTNNLLLAGDVFSPCTGCFGNCVPEECPALTIWIMSLHDNPEELDGCYGFTKIPDMFLQQYNDEKNFHGSAEVSKDVYVTDEYEYEEDQN